MVLPDNVLSGAGNVANVNVTVTLPGKVTFQDWHDTSPTYDHSVWINMPTPAIGGDGGSVGGPSALGSGGIGVNPWLAYAAANGSWMYDTSRGDICYLNTSGGLRFGTTSGSSQMYLTTVAIGMRPNNAANAVLYIDGLASQTGNLTNWRDNLGNILTSIGPTGTLNLGAGFKVHRTAVSNNASILPTDYLLGVTSTAANYTLTLPTASGVAGQIYIIKDESNGASTHNITLATTSAQTIDGSSTKVISTNYGTLKVYSDGTNWFTF